PSWFAEGLAMYFQTVKIEDDGSFDVGAPPADYLDQLRPLGPTDAATLLLCHGGTCADSRFYATAWALVAYLANNREKDLLRYVQRLAEVVPSAQGDVFAEVFPDLTPNALDKLLVNWVKVGQYHVHRYRAKLRDAYTTVRTLGDADVLAARGLLRHV